MLCIAACASGDRSVVATVNGEPIYKSSLVNALNFELSKYSGKVSEDKEKVSALKKDLLERMIEQKLLFTLARNAGITVDENEQALANKEFKSRYTEATFQKMLELKGIKYDEWKRDRREELMGDKLVQKEVISKIEISEADINKYYRSHKKEFMHGDEVHARQILVDDPKLAEEIRKKAADGENFAALAQEYSVAPEGKRGGDLGWFARGIMPKAFDEACFPLPDGQISPVFKTEYGFHIFKVIERRGSKAIPLDEVKDKVITRIQQARVEEAFNEWYEPLRKKAKVEVNNKVFNEGAK